MNAELLMVTLTKRFMIANIKFELVENSIQDENFRIKTKGVVCNFLVEITKLADEHNYIFNIAGSQNGFLIWTFVSLD